jgi:uncharacterized Zn finger protein
MTRLCEEKTGLFPSPREIAFSCSCPDWASMCKHVAAVLYGIGARLDTQPDLLFLLRKVDQQALVARASAGLSRTRAPQSGKVLDAGDLSTIFDIEMAVSASPPATRPRRAAKPKASEAEPQTAEKKTAGSRASKRAAAPNAKRNKPRVLR